jgi:membrane associated rhomboid family serine protease
MFPFSDASIQHSSFPYVNAGILAICVLVFLYEIVLGGTGTVTGSGGLDLDIFFFKWGFIAEELTSGQPFETLNSGFSLVDISTPVHTFFTIFSSMFIHGGFMHLAGNMMFLWVFGDNIEDRLGHVKYLVFYLIAGVAATLTQWVINTDSQVPLIGASGAISGVLGAYLVIYPNNRIKALIIFYLITVVEMRAMWLLGAWFIWQLIQGSLSLGMASSVNVAFFAHIGGFAAGMVLAGGYKLVMREPLIPRKSRAQPWDHWYQAGRGRD